jgi:glycerate dehydrogenase
MKIVVLDGHTLNPGDLSWDALRALGDCTFYDRTPTETIHERATEVEIVVTNKVPLSRETISRLPKLKFIAVTATGFNIVDVAAARERNILVANVPAYGTKSVAQMTFALLLELTQHVGHHAQSVREGRWSANPDWCYWDHPLVELEGLTMGIVGFGRIGQAVGQVAKAMGMNVLVNARSAHHRTHRNVFFADLKQVFSKSDVVSLHCPLTPETKAMVNTERLASMKRSAILINTSRGPLVDEHALAAALNEGRIAGAGLDVLSLEPPTKDNPLLLAKNCLITPHISWATHAARSRLMNTVVANVKAFIGGHPQNVIN